MKACLRSAGNGKAAAEESSRGSGGRGCVWGRKSPALECTGLKPQINRVVETMGKEFEVFFIRNWFYGGTGGIFKVSSTQMKT